VNLFYMYDKYRREHRTGLHCFLTSLVRMVRVFKGVSLTKER
jgi:hypothetical protein